MGAGVAFSPDADFGELGEERVRFSRVFQSATISVGEEGTTAAAAAAVSLRLSAEPAEKQFHASSPFLYFVRIAKTGSILFAGQVVRGPRP
jgi:serpin B